MPDWSASMQRTYEYYEVDPTTWKDKRRIDNVKSCTITRDSTVDTLGSATFDITESVGECYIRVYLITIQNGVTEKHPLGTFLIQTPSSNFDGKVRTVSMDAYTPLIELKENPPPLGYSLLEGETIMERACDLVRDHARAPVVRSNADTTLTYDFIANTNDTWITFIKDLIANAKFDITYNDVVKRTRTGYEFALDELGRILFTPKQDITALQPVWTYDDGNSSILYPAITMDHDLYDVPNVVEVIYSNGKDYFQKRVENVDVNSPTSIPNRGREIKRRITDPNLAGVSTDNAEYTERQIEEYAEQLLKELSTIEYTITYTHGYCPVRLGDCIRLNYAKAGLTNVKAKVIRQSIKCDESCAVTETAVFTSKLWR